MPKDNIKDFLDGNELDLSLNNLSVVPVKELVAIPKATNLDLSCNVLTSLPDNFCTLTHLVRLDLSKNSLTSLPSKFGNLSNLQHLDLLGNQLSVLPYSFCNLQKLKWLDLKDNPLEAGLKKAAGDCLDEAQCRRCAKNTLQFMKKVSNEAERQRQERLQQAKDREAAEKKKEEEERARKKAEKKAEKEKKRQQHQAKMQQEKKEKKKVEFSKEQDEPKHRNGPSKKEKRIQKGSCLGSCCFWFFTLFALLLAAVVGAHFYCKANSAQELCQTYYEPAKRFTLVNYNFTKSKLSLLLVSTFGNNPVSDFLSKTL